MKYASALLFVPLLTGCASQSPAARRGAEHLQYYGCVSCHTVPGVPGARASVGPPLDRLGVRTYIAGSLPNTPENLARWIEHPHSVRPDTAMPEMRVSAGDAADIAVYLETLR